MSSARVTISIDAQLLDRLDLMVQSHLFSGRSQAIQAAVEEKVSRICKTRPARECDKLVPEEAGLSGRRTFRGC